MDAETKESYERLCNIDFKLYRKLLKKTIMTIPYNATKFANLSELKSEFNKVKDVYIYKENKSYNNN